MLTAPLRAYVNFMTSSLLGYIAYFIITVFFLRKLQSVISYKLIIASLFAGICAMQIPFRIQDFTN